MRSTLGRNLSVRELLLQLPFGGGALQSHCTLMHSLVKDPMLAAKYVLDILVLFKRKILRSSFLGVSLTRNRIKQTCTMTCSLKDIHIYSFCMCFLGAYRIQAWQ